MKCYTKFVGSFLLVSHFLTNTTSAQTGFEKCGINILHSKIATIPSIKTTTGSMSVKKKQTTSYTSYPIPVIFHIIINKTQLDQLGGIKGISKRVDLQIAAIERDFNAANPDSILIPIPFKQYYTNSKIHFGKALVDPGNNASSGFELNIIDDAGFNFDGTLGSKLAFSDAKYDYNGGMKSWDPLTYLNVWVINLVKTSLTQNLLGITIPEHLINSGQFPLAEMGIVIHYAAFGNQQNASEYYLPDANGGKTLTHEIGHFLGLSHIWGDDFGLCPNDGGNDDGIIDTPPQSYETYGCPNYPLYDGCSANEPGIMFMNFMDYTNDNCKLLFTSEQATKMQSSIQPGSQLFLLTQHPEILRGTTSQPTVFIVSPNPAHNFANIIFDRIQDNLLSLKLINSSGQILLNYNITQPIGGYFLDLQLYPAGLYLICLSYSTITLTRTLMIN